MPIATAVKKGNFVYWYDEKGRQLGSQMGDSLHGYTGSSVSIRKGSFVCTYDEKGRQTGSVRV